MDSYETYKTALDKYVAQLSAGRAPYVPPTYEVPEAAAPQGGGGGGLASLGSALASKFAASKLLGTAAAEGAPAAASIIPAGTAAAGVGAGTAALGAGVGAGAGGAGVIAPMATQYAFSAPTALAPAATTTAPAAAGLGAWGAATPLAAIAAGMAIRHAFMGGRTGPGRPYKPEEAMQSRRIPLQAPGFEKLPDETKRTLPDKLFQAKLLVSPRQGHFVDAGGNEVDPSAAGATWATKNPEDIGKESIGTRGAGMEYSQAAKDWRKVHGRDFSGTNPLPIDIQLKSLEEYGARGGGMNEKQQSMYDALKELQAQTAVKQIAGTELGAPPTDKIQSYLADVAAKSRLMV